jgi:hypothetical protein
MSTTQFALHFTFQWSIVLLRSSAQSQILGKKDVMLHDIANGLWADHGEGLQVLHYEVGQKYEPHYDYFHDTFNTKNGGQRMATVLMYL